MTLIGDFAFGREALLLVLQMTPLALILTHCCVACVDRALYALGRMMKLSGGFEMW